jgi:hypothetical protein
MKKSDGYKKFLERIAYEEPPRWMDRHNVPNCETITQKWSTGGQGGGSCYDTGESKYYSTQGEATPAHFAELDKLLLDLCPDMTFLRYRDLYSEVVVESTHRERDYYGNYTDYAIRTVNLRKLYDYLVSNDLLKEKENG